MAAGVLWLAVFWYINWHGVALRTHWAFFPLWSGYLVTMEGFALWRGRKTLIIGNWWTGVRLFLLSVPLWWLFELMNARAEYWVYLPYHAFPPLEHAFWSTLCFSTVVPAIFVTLNTLLSFPWFRTHHLRIPAARSQRGLMTYAGVGILLIVAWLVWPQYGMASMWVSLFFLIGPVNVILHRPALMQRTAEKDWRMVLALFVAALLCGFFWEMWNWNSWPKWVYTFPYLDNPRVFEMPLAGYLGYLPFGLDVWAITALLLPRVCRDLLSDLK